MKKTCAWCAIKLRWWQFWRTFCPVCGMDDWPSLSSPPCTQGANFDKKWKGWWK